MSYSVTKETLIGEIINQDMGAGQVLATYGMHCFLCAQVHKANPLRRLLRFMA